MSEQIGVEKTGNKKLIKFGNDLADHRISELSFNITSIPVERLALELMYGRCLGQVYDTKYPFKRIQGFTLNDRWKGSSWIGVDIDDTDVPMETMHNALKMVPTFSMTTQSHMRNGHKNRYRLFYFFSTLMENYQGFCQVADMIVNDVRRVLMENGEGHTPIDNISKQKSRFFYGNPFHAKIEKSWMIYEPRDFITTYDNFPSVKGPSSKKGYSSKAVKEEKVLRPYVWERLHQSCLNPENDFEDIVKGFRRFYHIRFRTKVDFQSCDTAFVSPPENFMYLRFRWINKPTKKHKKPKSEVRKWHNHEHRRRILYAQLGLVAYMNNFELTIDQLVFHAIYLFFFAYCNNEIDGKACQGNDYITPQIVMDMAREIYQKDKDDLASLITAEIEKDKCAFLVNRSEAEKRGISVVKLLGEARSQYNKYLWKKWLELLEPYVKKGWSNRSLAELLEKKVGKKLSPQTIGKHVKSLRDYRNKSLKDPSNQPRKK